MYLPHNLGVSECPKVFQNPFKYTYAETIPFLCRMVGRKKGEREEGEEEGDAGAEEHKEEADGEVYQQKELNGKLEEMNGKLDVKDDKAYVKLKKSSDDKKGESKSERPSLFPVTLRCFGGYYIIVGLFKLVCDIIGFINPQILRYVLVLRILASYDAKIRPP